MAHTVSGNSLSNLAPSAQTCLGHYWFLKFAFFEGGRACRLQAAEIGSGKGGRRAQDAAGQWLPRGKKMLAGNV